VLLLLQSFQPFMGGVVMHSLKIITVSLILTTASPAFGQTVTYSLVGHERQMGPIEMSLYSLQGSSSDVISNCFWPVQPDSSSLTQPSIEGPILGGVFGLAIGTIAYYGLVERSFLYADEDDMSLEGFLFGFIAPSYLTAVGTHMGNNEQGNLTATVISSALPHVLLAYLKLFEKEPSPSITRSLIFLSIPFAVVAERLTTPKELRDRWR